MTENAVSVNRARRSSTRRSKRTDLEANRTHRYPDLVLQLVEEMIENIYLTRERQSVTKVMEFAIDAVDKETAT